MSRGSAREIFDGGKSARSLILSLFCANSTMTIRDYDVHRNAPPRGPAADSANSVL